MCAMCFRRLPIRKFLSMVVHKVCLLSKSIQTMQLVEYINSSDVRIWPEAELRGVPRSFRHVPARLYGISCCYNYRVGVCEACPGGVDFWARVLSVYGDWRCRDER